MWRCIDYGGMLQWLAVAVAIPIELAGQSAYLSSTGASNCSMT